MIVDYQLYGCLISDFLRSDIDLVEMPTPLCWIDTDVYGHPFVYVTWCFSRIAGEFNPRNMHLSFYTIRARDRDWTYHRVQGVRTNRDGHVYHEGATLTELASYIVSRSTEIKPFQFWRDVQDEMRGHSLPINDFTGQNVATTQRLSKPFCPAHVKEIKKLLDGS